MRTGGAIIAPLISCSASGKALAESLRRWWQGFSLPPIYNIYNHLTNSWNNIHKRYIEILVYIYTIPLEILVYNDNCWNVHLIKYLKFSKKREKRRTV